MNYTDSLHFAHLPRRLWCSQNLSGLQSQQLYFCRLCSQYSCGEHMRQLCLCLLCSQNKDPFPHSSSLHVFFRLPCLHINTPPQPSRHIARCLKWQHVRFIPLHVSKRFFLGFQYSVFLLRSLVLLGRYGIFLIILIQVKSSDWRMTFSLVVIV